MSSDETLRKLIPCRCVIAKLLFDVGVLDAKAKTELDAKECCNGTGVDPKKREVLTKLRYEDWRIGYGLGWHDRDHDVAKRYHCNPYREEVR